MLWLSNGRTIDVAFGTECCTIKGGGVLCNASYLHTVCFLVHVDVSVAIDVVESMPLWLRVEIVLPKRKFEVGPLYCGLSSRDHFKVRYRTGATLEV